MGLGARALLAASLGFAAAFVVACGGGNGLLSGDQASNLKAQLSSISSAVASGKCSSAAVASRRFSDLVGSLPRNVNTTLIQNLGQGAETISELAPRDCRSSSPTTTSSSSSTTTTSVTATTTATVTSTATVPTTVSTSSSSSSSSSTATNPPSTGTSSNGGAGLTTGQGSGGAANNGGSGGASKNGQ